MHSRGDLEKIAPQWLALSPVVRRFFTVTYPEVSKAAPLTRLLCPARMQGNRQSPACDPGGAHRAWPDGGCACVQLADQSEWIDGRDYYAEMHAYSLAAAMAGVRHRGRNTTMHQTLRLAEQGTGARHGCLQSLQAFLSSLEPGMPRSAALT